MGASFTIKQILQDHWDAFLSLHPQTRSIVREEVQKVLHCGDTSRGYALFYCPDCSRFRAVPFRCKSRFCNTCGVAYQQDRALSIESKLIRCSHRHVVFTIPQELRIFFLQNRSLLHLLFQAASSVILSMFARLNRQQLYTPGVVAVLHTFGRDLKWNPHIHMLVTEGGSGQSNPWRPVTFFPYIQLRKAWQAALLCSLERVLGKPSFRSLKNALFSRCQDGFYVHAPYRNLSSASSAITYLTRYIGRPAMAQSRIFAYDGHFVSFWYERHEDGKRQNVTLSAHDFIHRLIQHIPDKHFHQLRYYGLYATTLHPQQDKLLLRLSKAVSSNSKRVFRLWPFRASRSFGTDPLLCSCGAHMELAYLVYPGGSIFLPP